MPADAVIDDTGLDIDAGADGTGADDTGAADTGADSGADTGLDNGAVDNDGLDLATDDNPGDGTDPSQADPAAAQPTTGDGRTLPADVRAPLKALQQINPAAAGKLRDVFYQTRAYMDAFPTAADAAQAKDFISSLGGEEGVQQMQGELQQFSELTASYRDGADKFVRSLVDTDPEAFNRMVPHALNEFANRDPEAYGYIKNSITLNTLAGLGLSVRDLQMLAPAVADNPQAKQLIQDLTQIVTGLQSRASHFQQTQAQRNPAQEKLNADRKAFDDRKQKDFEDGISNQADSYMMEKATPILDQYLQGHNVTEAMRDTIVEKIKLDVGERLAAQPGFDAQLNRFFKAQDGKQSLPYIQRAVDKVVKDSVKGIVERMLKNPGGNARQPANRQQPQQQGRNVDRSSGVLTLKSPPSRERIDWSKTSEDMILGSSAVLTDGRRVAW